MKKYGICYLSMQCRTGKTLTALATAYLYGANRVLVVTKKKAIPSIWADYEALDRPFIIEIINYESVHKMALFNPDFVIIDEAHSIGAYPKPGVHQKALREIAHKLPCLFLSATPSPESYSQLYHQFQISDKSPWFPNKNFYSWVRAGYVDVGVQYRSGLPVKDYSKANIEMITKDTEHLFISYTQEEAGFSAEIDEHILECPMRGQTHKMIYDLKRHNIAEFLLADGSTKQVIADKPAILMQKLHQLSGGTVIVGDESYILDETKARKIKAEFKGKAIAIFYVFKAEEKLLHRVFETATDDPQAFQRGESDVFIGQVRRFREGVRLDRAEALIYYSTEFSYLSYEQGRNRLLSKERTEPANVWFACADYGIDKDVLKAVHEKKDFTYSYYKKHFKL